MTRPISRLHPSPDEDPTGVQQLLATLPDPGPMPADLIERITASLAAEQANHTPQSSGRPWSSSRSSQPPDHHGPTVSRGWLLGLSTAAAAAAIGGVAALNLLGPAGGDAGGSLAFGHFPVEGAASSAAGRVASGSASPSAADPSSADSAQAPAPAATVGPQTEREGAAGSSSPGPARSAGTPRTHIQMSTANYRRDTLSAQGTQLFGKPRAALPPLSAESPAIGPIGTALGVTHCLDALGVTAQRAVVDVARFDGAPAAVIVTDGPEGREVRVVSRECGAVTGRDVVLAGPMPLP